MSARKPKRNRHNCPHCTCGLTQVTWSDRETFINAENHEEVANLLVSIAQDHSYDRHEPYGLPHAGVLWSIVEAHLVLACYVEDWRKTTITMSEQQAAALKVALLARLEAL